MCDPKICAACHASFSSTRRDAKTCSARCRQALSRRGTYVITDEDRAAMRRAAELVPVPLPPISPEQLRAHVAATAQEAT